MSEPDSRKRKSSLKDIAMDAGVSISTVSHVLNDTAPISAEVRRRVMEIATQKGYLEARRKRAKPSALRKVLLTIPPYGMAENDANFFIWEILDGLKTEASRLGLALSIHSPPLEVLSAKDIVALAKTEDADGVLVLHEDRPALLAGLRSLRPPGLPIILLNGEDPDMVFDSIVPQNRYAAYLATNSLIKQGHRNILHITWNGRKTIRYRREGFFDAMEAASLPADARNLMVLERWDLRLARDVFHARLAQTVRENDITAIFCAADNVALHAMHALHEAGLKIPDDVSLVAFDNIAHGEISSPPLDTVAVPFHAMSIRALAMLEERLRQPDLELFPTQRVELACKVVKRQSSAAPQDQDLQ